MFFFPAYSQVPRRKLHCDMTEVTQRNRAQGSHSRHQTSQHEAWMHFMEKDLMVEKGPSVNPTLPLPVLRSAGEHRASFMFSLPRAPGQLTGSSTAGVDGQWILHMPVFLL